VIGLTPGLTYRLSYHTTARSEPGFTDPGSVTASIGTATSVFNYESPVSEVFNSSLPWTNNTINFTANATEMLLTISGSGGPSALGALDDVSITSVPEPSLALISLCIPLSAFYLRRRPQPF